MPIKVRYNGLEIDGNLLPLFSGAMHYWRLDPEKWAHIMDQVKGLGYKVIETYVPWDVHELAPGDYDFGRLDPAKDLDKFLTLATDKGLKVIVRPGPQINSELSGFGFPERVRNDPKFWALDAEGAPVVLSHMVTPFRVPSYANQALFDEFEPYLTHLAPILQKHLHPHGPIVAIQVENEVSYFFRTSTFDMDYSDAAIELFRHFLDLKYREIKELNKAYGLKYASFAEVPAPRGNTASDLKTLRPALDWAESREYQVLWALTRLTELFRSRGLGSVPLFHNLFAPWDTPFNLPELEADSGLDFVGIDCYPRADNANWAVDQARYMSTMARLPYIPEFGAGGWPLSPEGYTFNDHQAVILAPLMGGVRGMNFYMLVERDRWYGSPILADGRRREEYAQLHERFNKFLDESEWSKATPLNQAVLIDPRETQLLGASFHRTGVFEDKSFYPTALANLPIPKQLFGAEDMGLDAVKAFRAAAYTWLQQKHYSFGLADSAIATDKLKKHGVAFVACWGTLDEAFARRLRSFVEDGGTLIFGPALPKLNTRFEPLRAFEGVSFEPGKPALLGDGRLLVQPVFDPKAVEALLRKVKLLPEITLSDNSLELALHRASGRLLLFIRNPHAEEKPCTVYREGKFVLKPLFNSKRFLGAVEERDVKLAPHEIGVWELIPC